MSISYCSHLKAAASTECWQLRRKTSSIDMKINDIKLLLVAQKILFFALVFFSSSLMQFPDWILFMTLFMSEKQAIEFSDGSRLLWIWKQKIVSSENRIIFDSQCNLWLAARFHYRERETLLLSSCLNAKCLISDARHFAEIIILIRAGVFFRERKALDSSSICSTLSCQTFPPVKLP